MHFYLVALKIVLTNACAKNWVGWERTVHPREFSLHHCYKHKSFDEKILLNLSWCLAVSSYYTKIQLLTIEKELFKLSWLIWVTSHSSWEAWNIKTSKTNRWIIIADQHFSRRATIFLIHQLLNLWLQSF